MSTDRTQRSEEAYAVRGREFVWGFLDQGFSSAATLCLTLIVARRFGPAGVGAVAVPYASCLIVLGLQRSFLIDPYLTRRASDATSDKRALGACLSLSVTGAILVSAIFAGVGLVLDGSIGTGFLAFSPWLLPFLLQALLRSAAFRAGAGAVASASSAVMLTTFLLGVGIGMQGSIAAIVAAWGMGASLGLVWLLVANQGARPCSPMAAVHWWQSEAMVFASWLAGGALIWSISSYTLLAGIAAISGTAALGGYRAIESVFSPLSLLAPALSTPGFKAMQDSWRGQPGRPLRLAFWISGIATGCVVGYAMIVGFWRDTIFSVYGEAFRSYSSLILPITLGQALLASMIGFTTLLKAARRGRDIVIVGAGGAAVAIVIGLPLAAWLGLTAAAWGIAVSFVPSLIWAIRQSIRTVSFVHSQSEAQADTQL